MPEIGLISLGVGLLVAGTAYGIGRLAQAGLESTGRQPEAADDIFTQIVAAGALIDGVAFGALAVVLLAFFLL